MTFGEALTIAMEQNNIDAVTLSRKSGVSTPYISKVRSGATLDPSWPKACALIDALGMTLDEFLKIQRSDENS